MATLEKIRNKAGLLVIVVGLALFAFIIGDFLNSGSTYFRQTQEKVIVVNGEKVDIQQYQALIDEMTEVYKMQTGNNNLPDEYHNQIRQSVYDGLVQEIVLNGEMEKLGMTVGPDELFDMVQGENISPMLQQNPMFANPQTGMFDKTALLNFLKMIDNQNLNGMPAEQRGQLLQAQNMWLFWEKNIKRQRAEQKYTSLLTKAVVANKLDAKYAFDANAESSDMVYTMQSYSSIPDSTITVSKGELEKLYNQRKENYKQPESRLVRYIAVDINPSQEDYNKAQKEIESLKSELASSINVADVVNENSEVPYVDAFYAETALDPEMKQFATTAEVGDVHGPVFENDTYRMFKLVDKTVAADSVKASHIMIAGLPETRMNELADSLMTVLKGGADFAELAKEFSVDRTSENGGELGWMTEAVALRALNEEFKNALFNNPVNEISLVKSLYGVHLVKATEKTKEVTKYKMASIDMTVTPSSATYSDIYNKLNQFISTNNSLAKLEENAKEAGYTIRTNTTITANDNTLGTIRNTRQVVRWAFQNEKGKISDIFEADNKFIVAAVEGSIAEGYRPLSFVENSLRSEILAEKKGEKIVADLKSKGLTSLNAYADAMGGRVDTVKFVTFDTRRISGIGVEPKMNGIVPFVAQNQLTGPVAGNNGVYVFNVYGRNKENAGFNEEEQIKTLEAALVNSVGYGALQTLINRSEIEDNRIRFY